MEFTQGGRRGGYIWDEEDKDEAHKESPFVPPPPPPSCTVAPRPARIEEVSDEPSAAAAAAPIEKEHMFDKVVTPSDVGKLNRLVIPKQHAEKYFPLDAAANEKGLLLSFEDRNGKTWRFRYSYWNSSQSYVMTKGWSRFVKEKRLDAGDTVSFGRGVGEAARDLFFIDWKRRPDCHNPTRLPRLPLPHPSATHGPLLSFARSPSTPWAAGRLFVPPPTPTAVFDHRHIAQGYTYNSASTSGGITAGQYVYLRSSLPPHGAVQLDALTNAAGSVPMVLDSVPVGHKAVGKRVRLFGVNLDCPESTRDDNAYPAPPLQLQLGWAESSSKQQQYSLDPAIYRKQK